MSSFPRVVSDTGTGPTRRAALALSSGGARGLAHIGVIDWLGENGWQIEAVAGASMGALVGGIHAAGRLRHYSEWVSSLQRQHVARLLDLSFGAGGLFKGQRIMGVLRELVGDNVIEALPTAFTAVATDLESSSEVWLRQGCLFDAIRASMAAPMVFTPLRLNGRLLADGGLVNPMPISALPQHDGLLTIAVDLGGQPLAQPKRQGKRGLIDVALLSMQAVQDTVTRLRLAERAPDVRVSIPRDACGFHEFWRAQELIALGRERVAEAMAAMPLQAVNCRF